VRRTIIWINGAFGSGKTCVADLLVRNLQDSIVFDPEEIGPLVRKIAATQTEDFQDMAIWRRLVADTIVALSAYEDCDLVVPMTMLERKYRQEIFGVLVESGLTLCQYVLHVEEAELRRRIHAHEIFPDDTDRSLSARRWRLDHMGLYFDQFLQLSTEAKVIDASERNIDEIAATILVDLASSMSPSRFKGDLPT